MFDFNKWLEKGPIKLVHGVGTPDGGGCWMAALSVYTNDEWSDHPACVCPVIRHLCIQINDALPSDESRGRIIGPRLFDPVGTKADEATTEARRWVLADAAVRRFAPLALRVSGLSSEADNLASLPKVTPATAVAAGAAARAARAAGAAGAARAAVGAARAAAVAAYAADAAAYAAAYAAADAARAAAGAAGAAVEEFVQNEMLPVLDELLAIGNRTPIEASCDVRALDKAVQR